MLRLGIDGGGGLHTLPLAGGISRFVECGVVFGKRGSYLQAPQRQSILRTVSLMLLVAVSVV